MTDHLHRSIPSDDDSPQNIPQSIAEAYDPTTADVTDSPERQPDLTLDSQALQILDSSDDSIKVLDLDGRVLFISRGASIAWHSGCQTLPQYPLDRILATRALASSQ